jgi:hypothetical protein
MLPSDRYLADLLGLTEEQYQHFQMEVRKRAASDPQPAVVAGVEIYLAAASLLLSIGTAVVSALLKPQIPQQRTPGQPVQRQNETDPIIRNSAFAPRYGFDSQQDIATLGSIIPIVYANRELIEGEYYGGIRINTPMVWNQILSLGGAQMLRGVFLLGEGTVGGLDLGGFAIGSNTLQNYIFADNAATQQGSRVTVYFSPDGGRIAGTDRVLGRSNANDDGSSSSSDVFQVYWDGSAQSDFCSSTRPRTQTSFGVYGFIGNNFLYKVNPVIRPGVRSQYKPTDDERLRVKCPNDIQQLNARDKFRARFSTYSGIIGDGSVQSVNAGDTLTYTLYSNSDWNTVFDNWNKSSSPEADRAEARDVASAVASLQKSWDNRLIVGEIYKIGTALAVCSSRTQDPFVSEADLNGNSVGTKSVTAIFTVIEPGLVKGESESYILSGDAGSNNVATQGGHLLRYARAQVSTARACQVVEFGFRSNLGIKINNLCNFRDTKTYEFADTNYCKEFTNADVDEIQSSLYQSGVVTAPEERYSFFKIKYRETTSSSWTTLTNAYGFRSETGQSVFNYIRLEFDSVKQREFSFEPLSGFEVRNGHYGANASLYVLDAKLSTISLSENGVDVAFSGEAIGLGNLLTTQDGLLIETQNFGNTLAVDKRTSFSISYGEANPELALDYDFEGRLLSGLPFADDYGYIDDFAKLAEAFIYAEITSSAESGPEHEIVYVNEIVPNEVTPQYDDLALVGINIRSSAEWQQFTQFSSYVTAGKQCTKLLGGTGSTHLFPDVLYDLMTSVRYGAGSVIKPYMINSAEFTAAAQWCQDRKYFYDAAVSEPVNVRQWAADLAATHLLQFGESDGQYYLRPALTFTAAPIAGLFTAGNIAENSFKLQYFDPEDRDRIQISVRYREERPPSDLGSPGLFPVVRELLVRESDAAGGSDQDTVEQLDMSAYCTSRSHAIDAAKFLIRMRRIPTHTISFETMHDAVVAKIAPGDYIKIAMDESEYDEFNNGAVTGTGALVSTKPLADGTYSVIAWDGTEGAPPADATLTVSDNGTTAAPTGILFTVKLPSTQVRVYQVERISSNDSGTFTVEAMHMPVNALGILEVAAGFDDAANWTIQG